MSQSLLLWFCDDVFLYAHEISEPVLLLRANNKDSATKAAPSDGEISRAKRPSPRAAQPGYQLVPGEASTGKGGG